MRVVALLMVSLFFTPFVFAETLYLKDGRKIEGSVVQKTPQEIKINVRGVTVTYFSDEIEKIEEASAVSFPSASVSSSVPFKKMEPINKSFALTPIFSAPASSGQDKKALILSLIDASGARDNMNQMYAQLLVQYPPEDSEKLKSVFDVNEIILELVPVYEKYFTEEELKELIAFYQSQVGRKLLRATPLVMQDSIDASLMYFQRKIQAAGLQAPAEEVYTEQPVQ